MLPTRLKRVFTGGVTMVELEPMRLNRELAGVAEVDFVKVFVSPAASTAAAVELDPDAESVAGRRLPRLGVVGPKDWRLCNGSGLYPEPMLIRLLKTPVLVPRTLLPPPLPPAVAIVCRLAAEDAASPALKESRKMDPILEALPALEDAVPM